MGGTWASVSLCGYTAVSPSQWKTKQKQNGHINKQCENKLSIVKPATRLL